MRFSFGLLSAVALLCATASDAYPVHALIDNSIGFADTAKRDADLPLCKAYTIIQSRGTNETQGPSAGFVLMNGFTLANAPGGNQYFTVYPASWDQDSNNATSDIVSKIADLVKFDPAHCVILQGYSQGAAATTHALPLLSGASADAVKGVFMIGNPLHRPGLASNVDPKGGNSTTSAVGLEAKVFTQATSIPDAFINRTLDVCLSVRLWEGCLVDNHFH